MLKDLFKTVSSLIIKPSETWKELSNRQEEDNEMFLSRYLYPLIGFIALAAFLGILFSRKEFDIEIALKSTLLALLAALIGFYGAS